MTGRMFSLSRLWQVLFLSGIALLFGCVEEAERGAVVERVDAWGHAASAGLEVGDQILSWRSNGTSSSATDPLELQWVEFELAPRHGVTLQVLRDGQEVEVRLEDSGWHWSVRPPLDSAARDAYRELQEIESEDARFEAWKKFDERLSIENPTKGVWAAWRASKEAFVAGRVEWAQATNQRARERVASPELRVLLDFEVGDGLYKVYQHSEAIESFAGVASALAETAPESPLRALALSRQAAGLATDGKREDAYRISALALEIIDRHERAHQARSEIVNNTGAAAYYVDDLERAAFYYRQVVEELPGVDGARRAATGYNLGLIRDRQGYFERAEELLLNSLAEAESLGLSQAYLGAMLNALGIHYKNTGAFEKSAENFRRALEYFPSGGLQEAEVRLNLGNLATNRGDHSDAEKHHRAVLDAHQRFEPNSPSVSTSLHNLGRTLLRMERYEEGRDCLQAALEIEEEVALHGSRYATTLSALGTAELLLGKAEKAWELLSEAREMEKEASPDAAATAITLLSLGDAAFSLGRRETAIDLWRQGLEGTDKLGANVPGAQGKARFLRRFHGYHLKLAESLLEDGLREEAFLTLERSSARMMRAMLMRPAGRAAMKLAPEFGSRRRQLDVAIRRGLSQLESAHASADIARGQELRAELRALKVEREDITERLHRSSPMLERIDRLPEVSIERIRRQLPVGSLGLSFILGERASFLFVVSPRSQAPGGEPALEVFELPVTRQEVESRVEFFRGLIDRGRLTPVVEEALIEQGARLFDDLLRPAFDRIESASRLFIAPDGQLATLPFAALVSSKESLTFLAEWKLHGIVPSLSSMAEISSNASLPSEAEYQLVAIGDASFGAGEEFEPLPGSRQEVEHIGALFASNKKILLGEDATEATLRDSLSKARYVHFATHAFLDRRFPMDSSIALSTAADVGEGDDGLLHAWEVVEGPSLAADLVSLAGCETGLGAQWAGEGLVGMVQAFHYAGVPSVLASQWRVGDEWVGELTLPFYVNLQAGQDPMEALANAQRSMIDSQAEVSHPFYWASFSLFGASRQAPITQESAHN